MKDVVLGIRFLSRMPGFTITAILSITLGIGANAAIFTVVNALMLRPLRVRALRNWSSSLLYGVEPRDPVTLIGAATYLVTGSPTTCLRHTRRHDDATTREAIRESANRGPVGRRPAAACCLPRAKRGPTGPVMSSRRRDVVPEGPSAREAQSGVLVGGGEHVLNTYLPTPTFLVVGGWEFGVDEVPSLLT